MKPVNVHALLQEASFLRVTDDTTLEEAGDAMKILGDLERCMVGLAKFSGATPWEWHPEDELLFVLEGDVLVEVLPPEGRALTYALGAGDVMVVPAKQWHRQDAKTLTQLLFVTSREGNDASRSVDPRVAREADT